MNRGLVDLAKYEDLIELKKENDDYSLRGVEGCCFIENDKIIKIYDIINTNNCDLSHFKSKRISFPIYYIVKNDHVYGEVMPYFNAKSIDTSINLDSIINDLINHYNVICQEIKKFSHILMLELVYPNILYDEKKGFYLIDTTKWYLNNGENINYRKKNISCLDRSLFLIIQELICENKPNEELTDIKNYYEKIKKSAIGKKFLKLYELGLREIEFHFLELMEAYKKIVQIYYNDELKTINDMKKYTKIMKNS